jgi:hypothetical protein
VERISRAAQLDVGGIEFLVDDRDGKHYYYDINALSNFVADAVIVVGFDPWARLVDYLEARGEESGARDAGNGADVADMRPTTDYRLPTTAHRLPPTAHSPAAEIPA